jgi:hypothetical protein
VAKHFGTAGCTAGAQHSQSSAHAGAHGPREPAQAGEGSLSALLRQVLIEQVLIEQVSATCAQWTVRISLVMRPC